MNARLGERLIAEGLITLAQLTKALKIQAKSGGALGEILHHLGACNGLVIHQKLAEQQALPFADLLLQPPESALLEEDSIGEYFHLEVMPWQRNAATGEVTIATPRVDSQVQRWAARYFPQHRFALTSRRDVHRSLAREFSAVFAKMSCNKLLDLAPEKSAYHTMQHRQRMWLLALLLAIVAMASAFPAAMLAYSMLGTVS